MIEYVALAISLVALVIEFPNIARFSVYFFYKPQLDMFFELPNGKLEILANSAHLPTFLVLNKDTKREIQVELELITSRPVTWRLFPQYLIDDKYPRSGIPKGSGSSFRRNVFLLSGGGHERKGFPFEPVSEEYNLEVIARVKIKMTEFGLPAFFGEMNLKPVKKTVTVKPS